MARPAVRAVRSPCCLIVLHAADRLQGAGRHRNLNAPRLNPVPICTGRAEVSRSALPGAVGVRFPTIVARFAAAHVCTLCTHLAAPVHALIVVGPCLSNPHIKTLHL